MRNSVRNEKQLKSMMAQSFHYLNKFKLFNSIALERGKNDENSFCIYEKQITRQGNSSLDTVLCKNSAIAPPFVF
jgi:hypothetical protein